MSISLYSSCLITSLSVVGLAVIVSIYVGEFRSSDDYMDSRKKKGIFGDLYYKRELNPCMGGGASKIAKTSKTMTNVGEKALSEFSRLHTKARCGQYPRGGPDRCNVPDKMVPWNVPFEDYKPVVYTSNSVLANPVWADPNLLENDKSFDIQWNEVDGKVNRKSFTGMYNIQDGLPENPMGRTGIKGRGSLGRWGPNHAADPIVTRWKRNEKNEIEKDANGKPILQFVSVKRRDNGQWALPGGMVDPGEVVTLTLRREFGEEAMNSFVMTPEEKLAMEKNINDLFSHGVEIYKGYVDDPRNTDNSWMETVAYNFHDDTGNAVAKFKLNAGDDAVGVKWTDLSGDIELYASHIDFLEKVAKRLEASWDK